MRLDLFHPTPALRPWIDVVWMVEGVNPAAAETVLPNGAVELILNLGSPHATMVDGTMALYRRVWVAGLQHRPLTIAPVAETNLLGVRLRAEAAEAVLGVPGEELADRVVEWEGKPAAGLGELRERLAEAPSGGARLALVEAFLLHRADPAREPESWLMASAAALRSPRPPAVTALARAAGVSHRHLVKRFRAATGTTPKRLARVHRLQRAIRMAAARPPRWVEVAAACGYSDQSHLIREFRALTGVTPTEYQAQRDPDPNHLRDSGRRQG